MTIQETSSGKIYNVEILPVEDIDFKSIDKKRYFFDWKAEKNYEIYKLKIINSNDILGIISLERISEEWRVHIRLLTVSVENKGSNKKFDNIAANLITHAAKIAVAEYAELACVSLKPKSTIAQHYIDKYNMNITGMTLSLEVPEILNLIKTYDNE
ncbi:N-acetyltransferase [Flavobacterium cupreum]|uniref:N-acetyltransferase n=2 Tax=Flavobacterium TaxID=237 RepID=A0A434A2E1_9FLAO|nr:N-acetyltransferase [Flavobacterium cupreum]RUT68497.1 N-acetyltransferase [Flavobacterium cupreum]